jgi:aldose 1-epimerase
MLTLHNDTAELNLLPTCGGSIAAWQWRGIDIFRPGDGSGGVLSLASFPLVPFSNRIAGGRFAADGRRVALPANHRHCDIAQVIHGFGWQAAWEVVEQGADWAVLRHDYGGGDWPWPYRAEQHFVLGGDGLVQTLILTNLGDTPMPAGLGIHPYFPRRGARLQLAVTGRWDIDDQCIPTRWSPLCEPPDWLGGAEIDHGFTGRGDAIRIDWPTHALTITPDEALAHTIVYVPDGEDFFCVEPVSHMTDAVNRAESAEVTGMHWLAPGDMMQCAVRFAVSAA